VREEIIQPYGEGLHNETYPVSAQAADGQRSNFSNSFVVSVNVNNAEFVVQGRLGDQQIGDGSSVPHSVMVCEIAL
jgi:hypothetical protein